MKNKLLFIFIGTLIGIIGYYICDYYFCGEKFKYVELQEDYFIEDLGVLKKGTLLKIDKPMSEGFTRYILYLNLKGGNTKLVLTNNNQEVIPYWLHDVP